jgi:YgiT-type zinc finger domain-containing protein
MECQFCGGEILMTSVTKTFENQKKKVVIHNVPATVCECEEKVAFRPLLIIHDYAKRVEEQISHMDYESIAKDYDHIETEDLILQ